MVNKSTVRIGGLLWFVSVVCVCTKLINYLASHSLTNNGYIMQNNATSFFSVCSAVTIIASFGYYSLAVSVLQFAGKAGGEAIFPPLVLCTGPNWYLVRAKPVSLSIYNRLLTELSMKTARFYLITEDLY